MNSLHPIMNSLHLLIGMVPLIWCAPLPSGTGITDTAFMNITSVKQIDYSQVNVPCTPDFTKGIPWSYDQKTSIWYSLQSFPKGKWQEMDAFCRQTDQGRSSMATIKTAQEQSFIASIMKGYNDDVWIGGGRFAGLAGLYWYTKSNKLEPFTYSHFRNNEPNNDGNCIYISHTDGFRWGDYDCTVRGGTVCELRC